MKYNVVQTPDVHEPMGRTYSGMPIYSLGFSIDLKAVSRLVIIAGQVPLNREGKLVGKDDFAMQYQQVFANLKAALAATGAAPRDVVSLRTLLTREDDLDLFHKLRGEHYPEYFEGKPLPPNTLIVVKRLVWPDIRLEVEAIAAI